MKLAVSNIAWSPAERDDAYALLAANGIAGLEIAPGLFFAGAADPFEPSEREAAPALAAMRAAGLQLVSMQSLLFGVEGAALFGDAEARGRLRHGLLRAIALAGRFGIPNLVFGSPGQRVIPPEMSAAEAEARAAELFVELGEAAAAAGTRLGLEFNPAAYGTNFINTFEQALAFVEKLDHPAVTMVLDIGAMHMNGDFDRIGTVAPAVRRFSHVHMSEPQLAPAPANAAEAQDVLSALAKAGYDRWISIEMKRPETGLTGVAEAVDRLTTAARATASEGTTAQ